MGMVIIRLEVATGSFGANVDREKRVCTMGSNAIPPSTPPHLRRGDQAT